MCSLIVDINYWDRCEIEFTFEAFPEETYVGDKWVNDVEYR